MTDTPLIELENIRYKALSQISKLANNLILYAVIPKI